MVLFQELFLIMSENLEIEMEYIDGKKFEDLDLEEKKKYLDNILDILFLLDKLKIEKEEMKKTL